MVPYCYPQFPSFSFTFVSVVHPALYKNPPEPPEHTHTHIHTHTQYHLHTTPLTNTQSPHFEGRECACLPIFTHCLIIGMSLLLVFFFFFGSPPLAWPWWANKCHFVLNYPFIPLCVSFPLSSSLSTCFCDAESQNIHIHTSTHTHTHMHTHTYIYIHTHTHCTPQITLFNVSVLITLILVKLTERA